MIFGLTWAQWGLLFIVAAFTMLFLHTLQRTRAVLIFAGICLCGGRVAAILAGLARSVSHLVDSLTGKFFAATVPGILIFVLALILGTHLHPRGSGASKSTFWISAFLACLLIAGVSAYAAVNGIPADIRTGVTSVGG